MATTPRGPSPVKASSPSEDAAEQSMLVEPPTHLEEEITAKLNPVLGSPPPTQAVKIIPDREVEENPRAPTERQRQIRTPPPPHNRRSNKSEIQSPGHLVPFDWDDFEERYAKALQEADDEEQQLLEDFDRLVKYFNVWASASSTHDNERAVKRLQTRERKVRLSEQGLSQKKKHLSEVVAAFQSALALLKSS
ncbi:hypothetical protein F4778DRAFT_726287 [Xylariomycetidae sp. FL2044]|nr:hypothetical protein F4778DRAFT_726287 [Xylariomycetidae sp. FL2044]